MDASLMKRARNVFMEVADCLAAERPGALDRACGGDAALRAEVEALLRAEEKAGGFMSSPTGGAPGGFEASPTLAAPIREGPGTRIGPYKLLQLIGEGGFGSVFMAEQERPVSRRVALKIIKLGMDTRAVVARFEAERQALALMDHPSIARVLDAGATDTGRPYFVMELVKGEPVVEYCDKNSLAITDRLGLFEEVCRAVQHAHTKGVIHRDLKPSNILVSTQDGRPHAKVIDFGIAKATASKLTEKTLFTEHRALIGTPEYMSPEQAEGSLDIDTRTDVYSLGVLLYELLTGTTPFSGKDLRSAAYAEIQRIIREVEPPRPSTRLSQNTGTLASVAAHRHTEPRKLGTIVRGELDWIVMKALEKDRSRRYETANGLAMDIRRYLAGEAVLAAPPSRAYRVRKFVKRHRVQVGAAGLVALALILGMAGTGWQAKVAADRATAARKAEGEAKLARDAERARANELKQVADFQAQMLEQIDTTRAGVDLVADVRERFAAALERAGVPEAERAGRLEGLRAELARVNATDVAAAMIDRTILRPAVKAIDEGFRDQPVVDAQLRQTLADLYRTIGLYDAAYPLQVRALETRRRVLGEEHPDTLTSIESMGVLLMDRGRIAEAEPYYREALEKNRRVLGEDHASTLAAMNSMGLLLQEQGKYAEAEPYYGESLERSRAVLGEEHPDTIISIANMGYLLQAQGRFAEAEPYFREALEKFRRVLGEEHPDTLMAVNNMGFLLHQQGRFAEAEPYYREALERKRRVLGEEHPDTLIVFNNIGGFFQSQGRHDAAEPYFREALDKCRRVLGNEHPDTIIALHNVGTTLREQGRLAEGDPYLREALNTARRTFGEAHPLTVGCLVSLCILMQSQGLNQEVVDLLTAAEPTVRDTSAAGNRRLHGAMLATLGRARVGLGYEPARFAFAEANLLEAHAILIKTRGETHKDTRECVVGLVDLYAAWDGAEPGKGHDARAALWRARSGAAR